MSYKAIHDSSVIYDIENKQGRTIDKSMNDLPVILPNKIYNVKNSSTILTLRKIHI